MHKDVERRKLAESGSSVSHQLARLGHVIALEWCKRSRIEVLGEEVPVNIPGADSVVDILGRAPDGSLKFIETKWGIGRPKRSQRRVLHACQDEGVSIDPEFVRDLNLRATANGIFRGSSMVLNAVTEEDLHRIILATETALAVTYPTTHALHIPRVPVSAHEFLDDPEVGDLVEAIQRGVSKALIHSESGTSVAAIAGTADSVFFYRDAASKPSALASALHMDLFLKPDDLMHVEQTFGPVRRVLWSSSDPH